MTQCTCKTVVRVVMNTYITCMQLASRDKEEILRQIMPLVQNDTKYIEQTRYGEFDCHET